MVDGAYQLINDELKPGVRECDIVARVNKFLYENGSDDVEAINAISGERCNRIFFTDRMIRRPGLPSISCNRSWAPCLLPRDSASGRATRRLATLQEGARLARQGNHDQNAGVSTDAVCKVWPKAEGRHPTRCRRSELRFGHGLGLALHEQPIISRVVSLSHPTEIKEGMVFALERPCARRPTAAVRPASRKRS